MDAQSAQSEEIQKRIQALTEENLQLCDRNERLFAKVTHLESRLGHLATSNTDLSCRLIQSEEEKLKVSKELVEEKIQANKLREHFEEEMFELKNKILNQDSVMAEVEMERDRISRELQSAQARLSVGEMTGQNLREEFNLLKNSCRLLSEAQQKEVAQSEEMTAELLALAKAQDAFRRQLEEQQQSVNTTTLGLYGEMDRVRDLINRMSQNNVKPEDLVVLDNEQKNILGNQDEIKEILQKMKDSYQEQQKKLEETAAVMGQEQQQSQRAIYQSRQKICEQNAAASCYQSQVKEVEEENSRLQLQVKELNEEYRARLVCYIQDLADYIDGLRDGQSPERTKMRTSVDKMLQDVRSSYRVREEQLSSAARSYKKRLQKITKTHQALLIAYRVQREQILAKSDSGLDPGRPEADFSLESTELRDETERELQHLRLDKARLEEQLQEARQQMAALQMTHGWVKPDIRKQLKEVTDSTLMSSEKDRALLLNGATVAEAQVSEMQDCIDNHLLRYDEETAHIHTLHGKKQGGRSQSAKSPP